MENKCLTAAELNTLYNKLKNLTMDDLKDNLSIDDLDDDNTRYILTPWGCMSCTLSDYNIDYSHLTPAMGKHMVEDFMELMEKTGYVRKQD